MPYFQPSSLNFVNGGATQTIAQLIATYPASSTYLGMYARVSDLWGSVDEVMRCSTDGAMFYWRPQRTDYSVNSGMTSGAMTLTPLLSAPSTYFTATLLGNVTITPSTTNVWPGCRFEVVAPTALGLFSMGFGGLVGGVVTNLLGGQSRVLEYTSTGWKGK